MSRGKEEEMRKNTDSEIKKGTVDWNKKKSFPLFSCFPLFALKKKGVVIKKKVLVFF